MKQVQTNSLISHVLSDQIWWFNIKRFLNYSKTYSCKFMQVKLWHHELFHFHLPFWIWKVWKGREKIRTFEYLESKKSFLDEIKHIFYGFWIPMKNSGHRKLLTKLTLLRIFLWKFTEIYTQSNHFAKNPMDAKLQDLSTHQHARKYMLDLASSG